MWEPGRLTTLWASTACSKYNLTFLPVFSATRRLGTNGWLERRTLAIILVKILDSILCRADVICLSFFPKHVLYVLAILNSVSCSFILSQRLRCVEWHCQAGWSGMLAGGGGRAVLSLQLPGRSRDSCFDKHPYI
jgi:hypothetical protein